MTPAARRLPTDQQADPAAVVAALLEHQGRTFAQEAGIEPAESTGPANQPAPLYQLLVLAALLSTRISARIAVAAAHELFGAGFTTPRAMLDAGWQARVDALGRGHYKRYDERTSTMLGASAQLCLDRWQGDLRRLRAEADGDPDRARELLTEFPGIGQTGADIFLREVQSVWTELPPLADPKMQAGAQAVGLPTDAARLAELVEPSRRAQLSAALVRIALDDAAAREVTRAAAGDRTSQAGPR